MLHNALRRKMIGTSISFFLRLWKFPAANACHGILGHILFHSLTFFFRQVNYIKCVVTFTFLFTFVSLTLSKLVFELKLFRAFRFKEFMQKTINFPSEKYKLQDKYRSRNLWKKVKINVKTDIKIQFECVT